MYRPILAGMVGLALAGCAQTQTAMPLSRSGPRVPPVGLTPIPNIYEALNRENTRFNPIAMRPENGPVLADLGAAPGNGHGGGALVPVPTAKPDACVPCRTGTSSPPVAEAAPTQPAGVMEPGPQPRVAASPMPSPATAPGAPQSAPETDVRQTSAAPGTLALETLPAADPSIGAVPDAVPLPTPANPGDAGALPLPPLPAAPPGDAAPAVPPAPDNGPDPSIGAVPDAVPLPAPANSGDAGALPLPPLPASPGDAAPAGPTAPDNGPDPSIGVVPDAVPLPVLPPAVEQSATPAAPPTLPLEAPPAELPASATALPTAGPVELPPPAEPAPTSGASARVEQPSTVDPEVVTTAADATALRADGSPVKLKEAGRNAARVGDEVITLNELTTAVKDRISTLPNGYKPNPQEIMMITSQVLDSLVERSTLIQEAKRQLKNPKQMEMFMKVADKAFREEEVPPMLRKMAVTNEYELKQKLAEQGKSLDALRESYKNDFLAKGFLEQKLSPKMKPTLSDMRDYYNTHLSEFQLPEQWTWREVVVEFDKHASRAEARAKADAVLGRLRRNEDFAKVAQAESEGPNRAAGGLWETAPGSYAITSVNDALTALPIGQVSPILEGPSSYHIVRVESRRSAGPATFAEVQDKVRRSVHRHKVELESSTYLDSLLKQTVVVTMFDKTSYAPASSRYTRAKSDASVKKTSAPAPTP